ncbi:hypothetical protein BDR07DRAFT_1385238 [Suillus spraguei]|nr:hypothetical protein BDR07DRAFT_1385238 [Suillus spraguei]
MCRFAASQSVTNVHRDTAGTVDLKVIIVGKLQDMATAALSNRLWGCWNVVLAYGQRNCPATLKRSCYTLVPMKEINYLRPHDQRLAGTCPPIGRNAYTSMNIGHYQDLQRLDDFIDASRSAAKEDGWVLVVYPTIFMGEERFQYYYVVPDHQIIAWLEIWMVTSFLRMYQPK